MKSLLFLPVVLALGLAAGCGESDVDASSGDPTKPAGDPTKSLGDTAKGAMDKASETLAGLSKDLDLSNLSNLDTAKLQQLGKDAMSTISTQLGNIKDLASAKSVSSALTPIIEKLGPLKSALGDTLPNMESVKSAISSLKAKFPTGEIMEAIQPMLTKLQGLIA
jgi:hypothetical protein